MKSPHRRRLISSPAAGLSFGHILQYEPENGFREEQTPIMFDTDDYNVLIVANKYQTGFDQKKLCAMYVLKKLKGVNAVQTYSRLNRICPPYDKKTFILDFVNSYEDIVNAFSTYYTTTLLSNSVTPTAIYDLEAKIDGVVERAKLRTIAKTLYGEDIFSMYSGTVVLGAVEIAVRGAKLPISTCLKDVRTYMALDDVKEACRSISLGGLPLKFRVPSIMVKYRMASLLVVLIHLADKFGVKLSAF